MTKQIRVENADPYDHKVVVQVWDEGAEGQPDTLVSENRLDLPTTMAHLTIHSGRYLLVKVAP